MTDSKKLKDQKAERILEEGKNLKKMVQDRVAQVKRAKDAENTSKITSAFVRECLSKGELGDGELFAALFRDIFIFNASSREWYFFNGVHWQLDTVGAVLVAVDAVAKLYLVEASKISAEIQEKLLHEEQQ